MNLVRWCAELWTNLRSWRKRSASSTAPCPRGPLEVYGTYARIERVLTHSWPGQDRRRRLCRCHVCGTQRLCLPHFDFYAVEEHAPLLCHDCFYQLVVDAQHSGIKA